MKKYVGIKFRMAEPQLKGHGLGFQQPNKAISEFTFNEPGYKVVDENGNHCWKSKLEFECDYRSIDGLTFGLAIEALKLGKLIARNGWNGKGMFVMKQIPAEIGLDIIPRMQSVQQSAKDKLIQAGTTLKYENQILIIKADGTADSWVPSASDVFAEDWQIIE